MNDFHQGDQSAALSMYAGTLELFDGTGFHDAAFEGSYATYKLALALYAGAILQAPNPNREQMLATLLSMQDDNGGFHTDYDAQQEPGAIPIPRPAPWRCWRCTSGCNP